MAKTNDQETVKTLMGILDGNKVSDTSEPDNDLIVIQLESDKTPAEFIKSLDSYIDTLPGMDGVAFRNVLAERLADELDLPESLDDSLFDYLKHCKVNLLDAIGALNSIMSAEDKKQFIDYVSA